MTDELRTTASPSNEATEATFIPDYKRVCVVCDAAPTISTSVDGKVEASRLCGPCFFGEARMVDSDEWND